ncbi:CHAT domain-containing protein [Russula brevipes]|nr:CHAT domain-containing protein [Russula brevipes]
MTKFGSLDDLDTQIIEARIFKFRASIGIPLAIPFPFPFRLPTRAEVAYDLGFLFFKRYYATRRKEDLDQAIAEYGEALLRGLDDPLLTIEAFYKLTCALHALFNDFGDRAILDNVISYFRHLSCLPLGPACIDPIDLSNDLACALQSRYHFEGQVEDIEDAISLRRRVVAISPSDTDTHYGYISNLASILKDNYERTGEEEYRIEAISHLRNVLRFCRPDHPGRPRFLCNLAMSLMTRPEASDSLNDLDEAATLCQESFDLMDEKDTARMWILMQLAIITFSRHKQTRDLEDLERAISLYRQVLSLRPPGYKDMSPLFDNLAHALETRFDEFGHVDSLDEAISLYRASLRLESPGHIHRYKSLGGLAEAQSRRLRIHGIDDLEGEINLCREALALTPRGHPERPLTLTNLSVSLRKRSRGIDDDLQEAIELLREALDLLKPGHPWAHKILGILASTLHPLCVRDRLRAAEFWAFAARVIRHHTTLPAYRNALLLLQRSIDLGPTMQSRHEYIRVTYGHHNLLPMAAASYAIEIGACEEAVEILEQGRTLLWSSMRNLRRPLEQLRRVDEALADQFTEISKALEAVITTTDTDDFVQPLGGINEDDLVKRKVSFSRNLAEKRRLSEELETVVSRIEALPGFENFRRPVPFCLLQTAAMGGPVIIVNHFTYRSDILIVRYSQPIVHIPTCPDFLDRISKLADRLLETRRNNVLESKQYGRVLRWALEELYQLLGRPVLEKLKELGVPEQSRIWWYPTSILTSLPIHAAGPIPSDTNSKLYLSDLFVASYTPSLSALMASRSRTSSENSSGKPSLLIVGEPESLPGADVEVQIIKSLVPSSITDIAGKAATPENVIAHLQTHPWVHFTCHGRLRPGQPFDSSFKLQHDDVHHLTLLRIAQANLPTAELAFLAACHTAERTHDDGAPDEVLHLAAAMQFCGFKSVIGTMWAMMDTDGQVLSKHFYRAMFDLADSGAGSGGDYRRSAKALRDATQKFRRMKGVTLERWINFVHYGA